MSIGPTREGRIFERGYRAGAQKSTLQVVTNISRRTYVASACAEVLYANAAVQAQRVGRRYRNIQLLYAKAAVMQQVAQAILGDMVSLGDPAAIAVMKEGVS